MNRSFALVLSMLVCALPLAGMALPVDLTPRFHVEQREEGGPLEQIFFKHGNKLLVFCPPSGWKVTGDPGKAMLFGRGVSSVRAEIRHQEGTEAPTWDEPCMKSLREQAAALLPPAENPKLVEEVKSPFLLDNHEVMAYTFKGVYQFRVYKFSVLLLFMDKEQFSFVVYGDEREFDAGYQAFRPSVARIFWKEFSDPGVAGQLGR